MNKDEFVKWLDDSSFSRSFSINDNDNWEELQNYAEFVFDYLEVNENSVTFKWEEWFWGGRENKSTEYSFDEFIERYNNFELRN